MTEPPQGAEAMTNFRWRVGRVEISPGDPSLGAVLIITGGKEGTVLHFALTREAALDMANELREAVGGDADRSLGS